MSKKITGNDLRKLISEALEIKTEAETETSNEEEAPIPQTKRTLGDQYLQDYGKEEVEIPTFYKQIFGNSSILKEPTASGRIQAMQRYLELITNKQVELGQEDLKVSVSQEVSNIFILDMFESLVEEVYGASTSGLTKAGFLMEGFVALLFSGSKVGTDSGWVDVLTDLENGSHFSVKFMAPSSTNYQALSTVDDYFAKEDKPMRFLNIVKSKISKKGAEIKFFLGTYTKEDYEKVKGKTDIVGDKEIVTKSGSKYYFENPVEFQAGTKSSSEPVTVTGSLSPLEKIEMSDKLQDLKSKKEAANALKKEAEDLKKDYYSKKGSDEFDREKYNELKKKFEEAKEDYETTRDRFTAELAKDKELEMRKDIRGSYKTGSEARITFLDFGTYVGTMRLPSTKQFRDQKQSRLESLNTEIVQITKSLNELQNTMVVFSSTSSEDVEKKTQYGSRAVTVFNKAKKSISTELGDVAKLEERKVTSKMLKKLIEENFKK